MIFKDVYACSGLCVSVCHCLGLKKLKATVPWELPFQVAGSHPMWGMGIDFKFSSRAAHTQNYRAPSPLFLLGTPVFKCYFLAHEDGYEAFPRVRRMVLARKTRLLHTALDSSLQQRFR